MQNALEDVSDRLNNEKSLRVAAEHRATSLASQNSLKVTAEKARKFAVQ